MTAHIIVYSTTEQHISKCTIAVP